MAASNRNGGENSRSQTVDRAIDILEIVAEGQIALTDLTARLGLSKTSVFRMAETLAERGLLERSMRSGYRLGAKLAELAEREKNPAG